MKKKALLISLFLVMPLIMANSPAPGRISERYDDISLTITKKELSQEYDEAMYYEMSVTNTGKEYIESNSSIVIKKDGGEYWETANLKPDHFLNLMIGPGQTATCRTTTTNEYELGDYEAYSFAYMGERYEYDVSKVIGVYPHGAESSKEFVIKIKDFSVINPDDQIITTVTYLGKDYSVNTQTQEDGEGFILYTRKDLDHTQITVKKIEVFRNYYNYRYRGDYYYSAAGLIAFYVLLILLAAVVLVPPIIAIVLVNKSKRKYKKAQ